MPKRVFRATLLRLPPKAFFRTPEGIPDDHLEPRFSRKSPREAVWSYISPENRLADLAEKNSTMPRSQVLSLMSTSDARDWAERVRRRALAVGGFSDLLQKRSLASTTRSRVIRQMSQDK